MDGLSGQPEVQAQLLDVMGRVYQSLGTFDQARPLLERALQTRRTALGDTHKDVGDSLTHLGDLLILQGRFAEAEETLRKALAVHDSASGRESAGSAMALHLLGATLVDRGQRQEGRQLLEEALAIHRRVLRPDDPEIAESLSGLAYAASAMGDFANMERRYGRFLLERKRFAEAERVLGQSHAMRSKLLGPKHPDTARSARELAVLFRTIGRPEEAAALERTLQ